MKPEEIAWLAGLFEGEGSIAITRRTERSIVVQLIVGMTDEDVLLKAQRLSGVGHVVPRSRGTKVPAHWKPMWTWRVSRATDVQMTLEAMLPWFGERRALRAMEALEALASRRPPPSMEERFWSKVEKGEHWLWQGQLDKGYGRFSCESGMRVLAHRFAAGQPRGAMRNKCGVSRCVHPDHWSVYLLAEDEA